MTDTARKKILFLPKWYPNRKDLLNGIFIMRHAKAVAQRSNVCVLYVQPDAGMKKKSYEQEIQTEHGILTVRVYYNNNVPAIPVFAKAAKLIRYFMACMKGINAVKHHWGKPDICHIHVLTRPFFSALYFRIFYGVPFIISEHWSGYLPADGSYKGFLKKYFTKLAVNFSAAVTTVSVHLSQAMQSHKLNGKYETVPNVIDENVFNFSENHSANLGFQFLHVSNMDERAKNVLGILNAVHQLKKRKENFKFVIAGDGTERKWLEEKAMELGLLNHFVFFTGVKSPHEIAELMRDSKALVMFSHYENQPCVILESLACGTPVIATRVGGIPEVVNNENGKLVNPGDEKALLDAMLSIIENYNFDSQKISSDALAKYSSEKISGQFETLYSSILSGEKSYGMNQAAV